MKSAFDSVRDAAVHIAEAIALIEVGKKFVEMVSGALEAEAALVRLSHATQLSIETVGGLGFAAKQAGGDMEETVKALGRLNVSIASAAEGVPKTAEAFAVMGISVKETSGRVKDSQQVLLEMADKFNSYAEGPNKAALAQREFGRGYQTMMALFAEGSDTIKAQMEFWQQYSGVTTESAEAAHAFQQRLGELHVLMGAFATTLANSMVGTLTAVVRGLIEVKEGSTASQTAAEKLAGSFQWLTLAALTALERLHEMGLELGAFAAEATSLFRAMDSVGKNLTLSTALTNPLGVLGDVYKNWSAQYKTIRDGVLSDSDKFAETIQRARGQVQFGNLSDKSPGDTTGTSGLVQAPGIPTNSKAGQFDEAKAALDAFIKAQDEILKHAAQGEKDSLAELAQQRSESLVSIADSYAKQTEIQDEFLNKIFDTSQAKIDALRKHRDEAADPKQYAEANAKLIAAQEQQQSAVDSVEAAHRKTVFDTTKAYEGYAGEILKVTVALDELQGKYGDANVLKFAEANRKLNAELAINGTPAAQAMQATLLAYQKTLGLVKQDTEGLTLAQDALTESIGRINLAQRLGILTTLEATIATGKAREASVAAQEASVKLLEADSAGNAKLEAAAVKARLALDLLKASIDPLAESLNKSFQGDFMTAFDGFIKGTMTAGKAFESFTRGVISNMLKIAEQNLAEKLFGGSGGLGGLLSMLMGGGSGVIAGGGGINFGHTAGGGMVSPFSISQVNESGIEGVTVDGKDYIMTGGKSARVTPAGPGGSTGIGSLTVNVGQGVSRSEVYAAVRMGIAESTNQMIRSKTRGGIMST